jgi:predicted nuclease of predicted toxin-antitoxin system
MADTRNREANEIIFTQTLDFVNMVRVNSTGLNTCLTLQNITALHLSTSIQSIA